MQATIFPIATPIGISPYTLISRAALIPRHSRRVYMRGLRLYRCIQCIEAWVRTGPYYFRRQMPDLHRRSDAYAGAVLRELGQSL